MPEHLEPGTCSSCKAPVVWAITVKGKRAIYDAEPVRLPDDKPEQSLMFINADGKAEMKKMRTGFRSHWGSCPNAKQHRAEADAKKKAAETEGQSS